MQFQARTITEGTINLGKARVLLTLAEGRPLEITLHHPLASHAGPGPSLGPFMYAGLTGYCAWGITAIIERDRGRPYQYHIPAHQIFYKLAGEPEDDCEPFRQQHTWEPCLTGPNSGIQSMVRSLSDLYASEIASGADATASTSENDPKSRLSTQMDRTMGRTSKPADFIKIPKDRKWRYRRGSEPCVTIYVPTTRSWDSYEARRYFGSTPAMACKAALDDLDLWKRLADSVASESAIEAILTHNLLHNHGHEESFCRAHKSTFVQADCNIGATWRNITSCMSSQFSVTIRVEALFIRFPQDLPDVIDGQQLPHNHRYYGGKRGQASSQLDGGPFTEGSKKWIASQNKSKVIKLVGANHFCPSVEIRHILSDTTRRLNHNGNHFPSRELAVLAIVEVAMRMGMVDWMKSLFVEAQDSA